MLRRDRIVLLTLIFFLLLSLPANAATKWEEIRDITLINGTPYDWQISAVSVPGMRVNVPNKIPSGRDGLLRMTYTNSFLSGVVTISLEGTDLEFKIRGTVRGGTSLLTLTMELTNFSMLGYPKGSIIDWGYVPPGAGFKVIIAGKPGSFSSNRGVGAWMHDHLNVLGNRTLRNLCIPGSHDAGMNMITARTGFVNECNTLTQVMSVGDQLIRGARYFDIRPVISGGVFRAGHYSDTGSILGWQGASGRFLSEIIDDVNSFTATHQELIVLHLSHDLNTDIERPYLSLNQGDWNRLFSQLMGLNFRFRPGGRNPRTLDLTTLTLADFIDNRPAVVLVVEPTDPHITLGSFATEGFYTTRNFPVFDQYSGTNVVKKMATDQLTKLHDQRPNPDAGYFLLSWTLTQDDAQATACVLWTGPSIVSLAASANLWLYTSLPSSINGWTYPNILYIDSVGTFSIFQEFPGSSDIAAMAMAVNTIASKNTPQTHLIHRGQGGDTGIYVAYSSDSNLSNGGAWSAVRMNAGINTSDTPAAFSFAGRVYVLHKGLGTDPRIFVAQYGGGSILDGNAWSTSPMDTAINTSTAPAVAILNGTPYMFYKGAGADTSIYIGRSAGNKVGDAGSWSAKRLNPGINTTSAPAVVEFGGVLYLLYKGSGDTNIWIARSNGDVFDGATWTANRLELGINTDAAPGAVVYRGDLYMFYKGLGADTNIWMARATGNDVFDGASWTTVRLEPGINTATAPKPVVVGDSLYVFYKGSGDDGIWIATPGSSDVSNGNAWRHERLNPTISTSTGPGAAIMW
jgi:hypothetical protein